MQRRARGGLHVTHVIAVVVLRIHGIRTAVKHGRERDRLFGSRDRFVNDRPGLDGRIQREVRRQKTRIMVSDDLHVKIADNDLAAFRRFAERELNDKFVAVAAAAYNGFHTLNFARLQLLIIQRAVALFFVAVVEEDFERHILVAHRVRGDMIAHARLRDEAGLNVKS